MWVVRFIGLRFRLMCPERNPLSGSRVGAYTGAKVFQRIGTRRGTGTSRGAYPMRLYHKYILRKVALVLAVSAVVCSLSLAVLYLIRLGNERTLGVPPLLVLKLLVYYNVFLSIYSIPVSVLIACLLVFGRLSADNELTALRASGVAPLRIFSSTLALALLLCLPLLWLNGWAAPHSKATLTNIKFDAFSLDAFFAPGRTIHLKNYSLHIGATKRGILEEVTITVQSPEGRATKIVAEWGEVTDRRREGNKVQLDLWEVKFFIEEESSSSGTGPEVAERAAGATAAETTTQFVRENARLYQIVFDFEDIKSRAGKLADKDDLTMRELLARRAVLRSPRGEAEPSEEDAALAGAYVFEFNKRLVFSLTPLVFAFVGISLGVRVHRGERSLGSAIAVGIAVAYYVVIIGIEHGIKLRFVVPSVLVWMPCVALLGIGVVLMLRVSRGQ